MSTNDFHIKLATAYPGVQMVHSSKGTTLKAEIATDQGRKEAYVKLLSIDDIAREAICAVLARKLQLPMLQPYYVQVDPTIIGDYQAGNIHNVAFGLEADETSAFRVIHHLTEDELSGWKDVLRLAVFDEWIYNRDRIPNNLIFIGERRFRLIDHDESLPNYASPTACSNAQLLQQLAQNKSEIELYQIRKKSMEYVEQYCAVNWSEIYKLLLPDSLPGSAHSFNKYIEFLRVRSENMRVIINRCLGIVQQELKFPTPGKTVKKEE